MGLEFLLPLLIPILSPLATELVKRLSQVAINNLPPALVPNLSAGIGVIMAELFRAGGLDLLPGIDSRQMEDAIALGLGYGGTGVHQAIRQAGLTAPTALAAGKRVLLLPALLFLATSGCGSVGEVVKSVQEDPAMKAACRAMPVVLATVTTLREQVLPTDPQMAGDISSALTVIRLIQNSGCPPLP